MSLKAKEKPKKSTLFQSFSKCSLDFNEQWGRLSSNIICKRGRTLHIAFTSVALHDLSSDSFKAEAVPSRRKGEKQGEGDSRSKFPGTSLKRGPEKVFLMQKALS